MRHQKLMWHDNMRLTKSQRISILYIYISFLLRNKHAHRKWIDTKTQESLTYNMIFFLNQKKKKKKFSHCFPIFCLNL